MSDTEKKEERFRDAAQTWSSNSLTWASFALANFVLVVSLFTAFSVKTNVVFEMSVSLFLLSGVLFAASWALFQSVTSAYKIKLKDKRTGEYATNPRELYVKRAEYFALAGTLVWSAGVVLFLIFLEMYVALAMLVVSLTLVYAYVIPRYFWWRE